MSDRKLSEEIMDVPNLGQAFWGDQYWHMVREHRLQSILVLMAERLIAWARRLSERAAALEAEVAELRVRASEPGQGCCPLYDGPPQIPCIREKLPIVEAENEKLRASLAVYAQPIPDAKLASAIERVQGFLQSVDRHSGLSAEEQAAVRAVINAAEDAGRLRQRAEVAEARLAALDDSSVFHHCRSSGDETPDGWTAHELEAQPWPVFETLCELADTLRAKALGVPVEQLPERVKP